MADVEPKPDTFPERYLGDGVYASFDGFQIWLDTRAQPEVNRIALEPETFDALLRYQRELAQFIEQLRAGKQP